MNERSPAEDEPRVTPDTVKPRAVALGSTQSSTGTSLVASPDVHTARTFLPPGATAITPGRVTAHPPAGADATALVAVTPDNTGTVPNGQTCTAETVTNHGTPSLTRPKISLVYWGSWSSRLYDSYWGALANTPAFFSRLREYMPPGQTISGSWNSSYSYPTGATGSLTEATLEAGIKSALGTYAPTSNDIIVVLLPSGTTSLEDTQAKAAGHHSSYLASGVTIPWAVVMYDSTTSKTEWRSTHEVMEAITDPDATSGCSGTTCVGSVGHGWHKEIADPCNYQTGNIAGLTVQLFWSQSACRCVLEEDLNNVDVAADGYFGYTVYESGLGWWYADGLPTIWSFGDSSDESFAGDYNGDGRTEFVYFNPFSGLTQTLDVLNIKTGVANNYVFGAYGDVPVTGDFDNPQDGKTDLAVWQPSLGWRVISSATGNETTTSWGIDGDVPVAADYDGDGTTDLAVARPSNGTWYYLSSKNPGWWFSFTWGLTYGDIPIAADFDGDGLADWAFYRPSTSTWYVNYSSSNAAYWFAWGQAGDIPLGRDVDGDWLADLTVYRPSNGTFYTWQSSTWSELWVQWGPFGNSPIPVGRPAGQ